MNAKKARAVATAVLAMTICMTTQAEGPSIQPQQVGATEDQGAPAVSPSNAQLGRAVRSAVRKAGGVDMTAMTVRVESGVVTLSGSVSDPAQSSRAGEIAGHVPGVTDVRNRLTIQPSRK